MTNKSRPLGGRKSCSQKVTELEFELKFEIIKLLKNTKIVPSVLLLLVFVDDDP